jgi:hypothetical protein
MTTKATADSARNFVLQQGFEGPVSCSYGTLTSALMFQPRAVFVWVSVGLVLWSGWVFAALGAVLWWNALVPRFNVFELIYNRFLAGRNGRPRLDVAPAPRRFSQGMGGTFAAAMAAALFMGATGTAIGIGIVFVIAVSALVFGRFCMGSFVYYLLRGRVDFAVQTLPWGRGV